MRKLIITCDDCGLSEGINLATADLYEKGFITAATIMTNFPAAEHALALFSRFPSLDVGIHLNLTDGFPLTTSEELSGLTSDDGRFRIKPALFINAIIARQSFLDVVEAELTEQIRFFIERDVKPRHLTTHIHFHWFPSLRKIVYNLAQKFDIRWVRSNELRRAIVPFNMFLPETDETQETNPAGVLSPDYIIVLQYWMKYGRPDKLLEKLLSLQGTMELVVHPCCQKDDTYPQNVSYQPRDRFDEMQYFIEFAHLMRAQAPDVFRLSAGP